MSHPKITSKNLQYSTALPPFLQRLHADSAPSTSDGRHERPLARPRRARDADADADDEPVYVDEAGAALSGAEVRELRRGGAAGEKEEEEEEGKEESGRDKTEEKAALGAARKRKRKVGKVVVVGGEGEDGEADQGGDAERVRDIPERQKATVEKDPNKLKPKPKKKGKKIKLSFNDDDDG
jgi:PAS domain-containing protein